MQVKVINLATHHSSLVATMGWSHTGRTLTVAWPVGAQLVAGSYVLSVSVHDHHGRTLLRKAHSSGEASLTVTAANADAVALYERVGFHIARQFSAYAWEGF